ncbi:hypothetical protein [Hymenobacter elongatus]|uniref:Entericidin n=1 Tax=Hymenobacter elongatus TaxID=877208 RepID=A0A4Z0PKI9_9BACT|nr:hypothetical protein [Hymenobacter elongatus]TGE15934.1 hypothetical protein E5J99_10900 [Hymenobacter elongatus]
MKTTFKPLFIAAAFALFATTSCSEKTQENAEATTESAVTDAANNTENAAGEVKADMAAEPGDTAVVMDKEADKLVEETNKK